MPASNVAKFRLLVEGQAKALLLVFPLIIIPNISILFPHIVSAMTTTHACKLCDEPLVLTIEDSEGEGFDDVPIVIPDDVRLDCHCHYHWYVKSLVSDVRAVRRFSCLTLNLQIGNRQCLMDMAVSVLSTLQCPSCHAGLNGDREGFSAGESSSSPQPVKEILARYTNEGGTDERLDIFPFMKEEAEPEAATARAFHVMCAAGDIDGTLELLHHASDRIPDVGDLVRYQDPLNGKKSGLHLAVENQHEGVAWLLLWLSSNLPLDSFPGEARQAAESIGLGRLNVGQGDDIRTLQDDHGNTAANLAQEMSGFWLHLIETGVLNP